MIKDLYEVYVAYDKQGNPLYVGQGAKGRHKHCTSGKSHNKLLNKFYFTQGENELVVKVIYNNLTKEDSLRIEKEMIQDLNPEFNMTNKILNIKVRDFKTDYVTLDMLREYKSQYVGYFKSISHLSEYAIEQKVLEDANIAEDMFNRGHSKNLVRMCGEECFYNTPFFVKHKGCWVVNKAARDLFDSTAKNISMLF